MYLVDTSVWVDYLRNKKNQAVECLEEILDKHIPFGITSIIYQEILQGAKSPSDFKMLEEYFSTQRFFYPADDIQSYQKAAHLYFQCRQKGITIRSSIDCLIVQVAIDNHLTLLHNDRNYLEIKKISTTLRVC